MFKSRRCNGTVLVRLHSGKKMLTRCRRNVSAPSEIADDKVLCHTHRYHVLTLPELREHLITDLGVDKRRVARVPDGRLRSFYNGIITEKADNDV